MNEEKQEGKLYTISQLLRHSFSIVKSNIEILLGIALVSIALSFISHFLSSAVALKTLRIFLPLFFIIIGFIPAIALIFAVDNLSEGNPVTIGKSFDVAFKKFFPYLWVSILVYLVVMGGFILLIVPGIIFFVWFCFSTYALIVEDRRGVSALARSRQLVRGNWWYVLGIGLACGIVYGLAIYGPFGILYAILHFVAKTPKKFFSALMIIPGGIMAIPLTAVSLLLFKNLREVKGDRVISVPFRLKTAIIGIVVLTFFIIIFFAMLLPAFLRGREQARRAVCMSNLKQIGLAIHIYAQDYNENFPEKISQLYPEYIPSLKIFICPSRLRITEKDISKDFNICYEYISGMTEDYSSDCLIAYDKEENHKGKGRNTVFVDGHVKWIQKEKWGSVWQIHIEKFEASKERIKQK